MDFYDADFTVCGKKNTVFYHSVRCVNLWSFSPFFTLFHTFQEMWATDLLQVQEYMFHFLRDPLREIEEPYFTLEEVSFIYLHFWPLYLLYISNISLMLSLQFVTFLFSKENTVWDLVLDTVCPQNMDNPLSHYWISSSHNT